MVRTEQKSVDWVNIIMTKADFCWWIGVQGGLQLQKHTWCCRIICTPLIANLIQFASII